MEKIDTKSIHGHLFTCDKCNKFHFEFNQIAIDFSSISILENFHEYLTKLDGNEFEQINSHTQYIRKIHIPFPNTSIKMVLSQADLAELKVLVENFTKKYKTVEFETSMIKKLSQFSEKQLN